MSNGITYCFDDQDVSEAAHLMEQKQSHRLPVLNRRKRTFGIGLHPSHDQTGEVVEAVVRLAGFALATRR